LIFIFIGFSRLLDLVFSTCSFWFTNCCTSLTIIILKALPIVHLPKLRRLVLSHSGVIPWLMCSVIGVRQFLVYLKASIWVRCIIQFLLVVACVLIYSFQLGLLAFSVLVLAFQRFNQSIASRCKDW